MYQPCDLVSSTRETIVRDFNKGEFPTFEWPYSVAVCSGVLEYIRDEKEFLRKAAAATETLIVTYNVHVHGSSKIDRLSNHWINHHTRDDLEKLFLKLPSTYEFVSERSGEMIYRLTPLVPAQINR